MWGAEKTLNTGGHSISVTNPDKILFPKLRVTKADVVAYYQKAAKRMLPLVKGRCVTMHRFPDGIGKPGFFQQEISVYFPKWVSRKRVKKEGGSLAHLVFNTEADIVYSATQAVITPHIWLSRADKLQHPDRMIFDLDPPKGRVNLAREAARALKKLLDELWLPSFIMTTGIAGFHVVVPLKRKQTFDEVRLFARAIAETLSKRHPKKFTIEQRKNKRRGRVFIDYLRNAYAQTGVAPYALRAHPDAPVATPIEWSELARVKPGSFTIKNIAKRLAKNPWKGIDRVAVSLSGKKLV